MARNPVEGNPVARVLLGLAVVTGMFLGGGAAGRLLSALDVPYGAWIGTAVGAVAVFVAVAATYRRYDA